MVSKSTLNRRRKKLVEALRSGKYEQTRGELRSPDDKFCCLGVACEVAGLEASIDTLGYVYDGETAELPLSAREYFGFKNSLGEYYGFDEIGRRYTTCLANENDGGKSFSEIADIIESRPEGLFEQE